MKMNFKRNLRTPIYRETILFYARNDEANNYVCSDN